MNTKWTTMIGAAIVATGLIGQANAMPLAPVDGAIAQPQIENARLICPPFRPCYRVYGGPYGYGGYGYGYRPYRPYGYRPYGYYRPYRFY